MTFILFSRSHRHFETQILIEKNLYTDFVLNQWLQFYQTTSTDTALRSRKEVMRVGDLGHIFKVTKLKRL